MLSAFRRYLLAGVLVILPIWVTLSILKFLVNLMDKSLALLPKGVQPEYLLGFKLPGLGIVISLALLLFTGMVVTNFLGRRLVVWGEWILARIPLVSTIYGSVKQILETLLLSGNQSFRRVVLVEYPRRSMWSLAFQTGEGWEELQDRLGQEMVNIFIPTTPNPTSGFLMMVPRADVIELDMNVDVALKLVISLGVIHPSIHKKAAGALPYKERHSQNAEMTEGETKHE